MAGKKKDKLVQIRVPRELAAQALAEAAREEVSLSQKIRELLGEWLRSKRRVQ
jgi:predicted HicB family RNase H-like nuclease